MGDLEDKFFKKNIPGRWSSFEDNENVEEEEEGMPSQPRSDDFDEASLIQEAKMMVDAEVPEPIRRQILAERLGKSNTGVKGVLADYQQHVKMETAQRITNQKHRDAVLLRIAQGHRIPLNDQSQPILFPSVFKLQDVIDQDDEEEEYDDEDDEFMMEFRRKRLEELKVKSTLPTFGICKDVDSSTFLDEIEKEDHRVIVIVHLFEPSVQSCVRTNRFLEDIAHTHRNIKFLRMQASSNMIPLDIVTLPILTIYRSGESLVTLAGLTEELGEFFTKDDLEWLIETSLQTVS